MNEQITMTAEQWAELKELAQSIDRAWNVKPDGRAVPEWTPDELSDGLLAAGYYGYALVKAIAAIEDENTRRERLGLAGVEL